MKILLALLAGISIMTGQFVYKISEEDRKLIYAYIKAMADKKEGLEYLAERNRNNIFAKIDKPELIVESGHEFYSISLEPKLVQEVRDSLKLLDILDPFIEKMFVFLHEGGHVKAHLSGISGSIELNEAIADLYALNAYVKLHGKECFRDLIEYDRPLPYLNPLELIYYSDKLLLAQQKGDKIDVISYARKVVAERKKDGYKGEVMQGAKKLLNLTTKAIKFN